MTSIVTLQSGFPFTPQLSYNPSNNGDTRNPVRPFVNPNFKGSAITGKPSQWFNPNAFLQPRPTAASMAISEETPLPARVSLPGISPPSKNTPFGSD